MTINELCKICQEAIDAGYGDVEVYANDGLKIFLLDSMVILGGVQAVMRRPLPHNNAIASDATISAIIHENYKGADE